MKYYKIFVVTMILAFFLMQGCVQMPTVPKIGLVIPITPAPVAYIDPTVTHIAINVTNVTNVTTVPTTIPKYIFV